MRKHVVALFAAALAAAPLAAEEPKKGEMPKAPAELSELSVFAGTWTCTGTAFASPMGPEHETAATVRGAKAVGGRWIHLTYDEKGPNAVHAAMYMGYDAGQKKYVLGCVDSFGGYCTQTSAGWNADSIVFEGTGNMDGRKAGVRDTFERKGTSQIRHLGEMQGQDGKWTKVDEETCRKAK